MDKDRSDKIFEGMTRRNFLVMMGASGVTLAGYSLAARKVAGAEIITVEKLKQGEDVFAYISRVKGGFDQTLFQQESLGVAGVNAVERPAGAQPGGGGLGKDPVPVQLGQLGGRGRRGDGGD